jgi:hypothetical protein
MSINQEKIQFKIDPEFRALIPELLKEEREQLEANLKQDGCRDSLVIWKGLLLDGYHRWRICDRLKIEYRTVELTDCRTRKEAMVWMIKNQLGRRNLTDYARTELVLKLEPLIAFQAKVNQGQRTDIYQNSGKSVTTDKELAKIADVSHDTVAKVKVIAKKAPEETKEKLRRGETSINREYQKLKTEPPKKKSGVPEPQPEKVTSLTKYPETPEEKAESNYSYLAMRLRDVRHHQPKFQIDVYERLQLVIEQLLQEAKQAIAGPAGTKSEPKDKPGSLPTMRLPSVKVPGKMDKMDLLAPPLRAAFEVDKYLRAVINDGFNYENCKTMLAWVREHIDGIERDLEEAEKGRPVSRRLD